MTIGDVPYIVRGVEIPKIPDYDIRNQCVFMSTSQFKAKLSHDFSLGRVSM